MATVNKSMTATYCVFKRTSFLAGHIGVVE